MNVIITGTTGMIGESVLLECLTSPAVDHVLILNRNSLGRQHAKLVEVLHKDFTDFSPLQATINDFAPDACYHCMGVSSVGMDEESYSRLTFDVTKSLADTVYAATPGAVFTYVSGAGSDETESGNTMWARVKGKTENYVLNRGFKDAYAFRIGAVIPEKGVKSSTGWVNLLYTVIRPIFGLMKHSSSVITSSQLGQSMIAVSKKPVAEKRLESKDIAATVAG
ncbi:MAG: nucleoside-diphosphate-sugar epimerase [Bdellovibrionota bacterium]|jgi:nucleoside-diphosphate-sugar epimerase